MEEDLFGVTYSATEAATLAGLSYRQVDYLAREDVVRPTRPSTGSGTHRRYSAADLAALRVAAALLPLGARYGIVRRVLEQLGPDVASWPEFVFVSADGTAGRNRPPAAACWMMNVGRLLHPERYASDSLAA